MRNAHTPVLLDSVLSLLQPRKKNSTLVDATLGEGGHAEAFLSRYPDLFLYGVDIDADIISEARKRLKPYKDRMRLINESYLDFFRQSRMEYKPDLIFFDLGLSMYHYIRSGRGFSFKKDEPLDMRFNMQLERNAADIVNELSEKELKSLIGRYGEEKMCAAIARAIVRERVKEPITRSAKLACIIKESVPPAYRYGRLHPATRTFQALRIAVNNELLQLEDTLEYAFNNLEQGGKLGLISFHSLEDRIVKHFFKEKNKSCTCPSDWPICQCEGKKELEILTKKPITASREEIDGNPASRSAKFRAAEKL